MRSTRTRRRLGRWSPVRSFRSCLASLLTVSCSRRRVPRFGRRDGLQAETEEGGGEFSSQVERGQRGQVQTCRISTLGTQHQCQLRRGRGFRHGRRLVGDALGGDVRMAVALIEFICSQTLPMSASALLGGTLLAFAPSPGQPALRRARDRARERTRREDRLASGRKVGRA